MRALGHDAVSLAFDDAGEGDPPLLFVHGLACHAGFWSQQLEHFKARHRVVAVDLRGHGRTEAPRQIYTVRALSEDLELTCEALGLKRPVVIGHSLGGLVALDFAAAHPERVAAAALIDSVLLADQRRPEIVRALVAGLRGGRPDRVLSDYFRQFFTDEDDPRISDWILAQVIKTPPYVTSSVWEQSLTSWDDAGVLAACRTPLLYLDAGTPNCDLARAVHLNPGMRIGRTIGSGHFSPLQVPAQVNSILGRFIELYA